LPTSLNFEIIWQLPPKAVSRISAKIWRRSADRRIVGQPEGSSL
jgi:hypothetical protein